MAKTSKSVEQAPTASAEDQAAGQTSVKAVEFPEAEQGPVGTSDGQLSLILDMEVPLSVILGQTELPVHKLLKLGPGAVIPLGKEIDAPVEIYLQGTRFAQADVVVVDDKLAVRIKQIVVEQGKEQSDQ